MNRALAGGVLATLLLGAAFLSVQLQEDPSATVSTLPGDTGKPQSRIYPGRVLPIRTVPLTGQERERGESALRNLRIRWDVDRDTLRRNQEAGRFGCGWRPAGTFVNQEYQPEFRLLVHGYPAVAEAWAIKSLEGEAFDPDNRAWAVAAISTLAQADWPGAEGRLAELCRDPLEWVRNNAAFALARTKSMKKRRELFRTMAREEAWAAVEALSYFSDTTDHALLSDLSTRFRAPVPYPQSQVMWEARKAMVRTKALENGSWEEMVRRAILEEPGPRMGEHFVWALRIVADRRPPWCEAILRRRIAAGRPLGLDGSQVEMEDDGFDLALLTLTEIGGAIDAQEETYLRRYGFLCEARARLAEVLKEKGY